MNSQTKLTKELKTKLSKHRFEHTISVLDTALKYASLLKDKYQISDGDMQNLEMAALLHDACKELSNDELLRLAEFYKIEIFPEDRKFPNVLHARVGAAYVKDKYKIDDPMILNTIAEHTLGSEDMSTISKILYLADFIEPLRDKEEKNGNPNKETYCDRIRKILEKGKDLDKALLEAMNLKINHTRKKGHAVHPISIAAQNAL